MKLSAAIHSPKFETLFESRTITVKLARLKPGQRLELQAPGPCLLTAGQGRVRLHGPYGSVVLRAQGQWRIERGERWKICARTAASAVLLMNKTGKRPAAAGHKHNPEILKN